MEVGELRELGSLGRFGDKRSPELREVQSLWRIRAASMELRRFEAEEFRELREVWSSGRL